MTVSRPVASQVVRTVCKTVRSFDTGQSATAFPISGWQFRVTADRSYTDAGTTLATTIGDRVYQVNDISGSNHVTQTTLANRPIFLPSCALTNRPAIRFQSAGVNPRFVAPSVSINSRNFSFYVVFRPVLTGDDSYGLFNFGSTAALSTPMMDFANGVARSYQPLNSTANQHLYGNPLVYVVTGSASAISVYRSNTKATLAAYNAATVSGGSLFWRGDGYSFKGANIYEFGLIDSVLSDSDVASIVTYATSKYGLRTTWTDFFGITGDSLTEGQLDNTGHAKNLGQMMGDYLGSAWKMANAGVSALQTPAIDTRAAYGLDKQVVGVSGRKVCVFLGGTNDLGLGAVSAATLESRVQTFITNRTNAGFSEIYIGTITKRDDASWSAGKETERTTYNTWVRAQSGTLFTGVVDLDAQSAFSNASDTTYYDTDKLHWKQAARDAAFSAIKTAIGV